MPRTISGRSADRKTIWWWAGGLVAAVVLVLGVSGTLSSWTSAIITNDNNTTSLTEAMRLVETDGTVTCDTGTSDTNTVTCSDINKYGGTSTPLAPGDAHHVTVTLTNRGTGTGDLTLSSESCQSSLVDPADG
ncbi:MAG: hypothetical protein QM747_19820 [Nocardioides sp.]